jgi:hypothetical protein
MVLSVLVLLTILTLVSADVATVEQRTTGNVLRGRQAFEAAMTGYHRALSQLYETKSVTTPVAPPSATPASRTAAPGGGTYAVEFCRIVLNAGVLVNPLPAVATNACTPAVEADKRVIIYARGWSDDGTALHHVVAVAEKTPAFPKTPSNPLTAQGTAIINGSGDVTNPEGRLTVWSGKSAAFTNANFKTNILSPSGTGVIESSSLRQMGVDVAMNDGNLSNVTGDAFFTNFMGYPPLTYAESVGAVEFPAGEIGSHAGSASNLQVLWSEGDTRLSSTAEFGSPGNLASGVSPEPSVVIIDGNLEVAGNVTVNGVLYVVGNLTGNGNLTVNGAVIVQGNVDVTGSVDIVFNSLLLDIARNLGRGAAIPGSWKDWNDWS